MNRTFSEMARQAGEYLSHDIWMAGGKDDTTLRKLLRQTLKWLVVLVEGMNKDRLLLRASALTFTTILSIVPFLAVAFSVLKGVGFQNTEFIRELLLRFAADREQVVDNIITYINNTNVQTLGVVGVATLFITVITLLSNIERSFNAVWGVKQSRSIGRKTTDYFSISFIFPVLIVAAISLTASLQSYQLVQDVLDVTYVGSALLFLLGLLPYVSVWLALMFLYVFIPNVRVRFLPALGAGVLAGTIWQLAQWAYVSFQFGAAKYNAIYGSFAQLPMFLVWVFVSWFIVLLGAEMCFAFQNLESFEKAAKYERVSTEEKLCAGLAVLMDLTRRFREEADLPDMDDLSGRLQLPENLLADVLALLVEENVVARVDDKDHERYALRRPPERMLLCDVRGMFVNYRSGGLQPSGYEHYDVLRGALEELAGVCRESGANVSLAELYRRAAGKSAEDADRDAEAAA